jgi:asparagine synthase (glutamine-hydrolysing)/putative beta-lactam synthetase
MSGLVGWIDLRRDLRAEAVVLRSMTETMRHRGPDAEGIWVSRNIALGHRKLAIAGSEEAEQPVVVETENGPVAVAHVGAIDNAIDLRREIAGLGGRSGTGSDTDVLLESFLAWGSRFVERLRGAFAFAIWDGRTRRLLLGRDRLGVKPLYYFEYPGGVVFASEPKGIMANPLFEARLDFLAVPILLQPRLALPGETPLIGLREVPPAHLVSYSEAGLSLRRFWRLTSAPHRESFDETAGHVRGLMEDIVSRQVTTSASCGAMLSGGVDSTSVAALAMKALQKQSANGALATFCVQFESDPAHFVPTELRPDVDAPFAAIAADAIGTNHSTVTLTLQDLVDAIPATRSARDLPGWGQFDASMYVLFREMRRKCTVALTGEAADEVFGGYPYLFDAELIRRGHFPWLGDGPKLSDYLSPVLMALVDPQEDERARYSQLLSEVPRLGGEDPANARMREVLFLGMSGPLAVILERKERMSMSLGLEVRLPFCDHRLVEYLWNVPWSMKCSGGVKGLLKAAMADLLPPSTVARRKSAYPHVQNPRYDQALIREATSAVNDAHSPIAWMFDTPRLNGLIQRISANEVRSALPGGASGPYLLIQLVEMRHWIDDYQVSLR